jgi:hypothetical protein
LPGTDVPLGPTYFKIDKRALETNTLIDLENIMSSVSKEKLDEMLQRISAKPPRDGTISKRRQAQEQEQREKEESGKKMRQAPDRIKNMSVEERKSKTDAAQRRRIAIKELMPKTELEENKKIAKALLNRQNFLKNPCHTENLGLSAVPTGPLAGTVRKQARKGSMQPGELVPTTLQAQPTIVNFVSYETGNTYTTKVRILNVTSRGQRLRVFPLSSQFFHASLPIYSASAGAASGTLAAGMWAEIEISFAPDSLADYEDTLVVATEV